MNSFKEKVKALKLLYDKELKENKIKARAHNKKIKNLNKNKNK
jgi:hypothetical protein